MVITSIYAHYWPANFRVSGQNFLDNILKDNQALDGSDTVCRGRSFNLRFIVANLSKSPWTTNLRFYLAPNKTSHNATGIALGWFSGTSLGAMNQLASDVMLTLPINAPLGTNYVYWDVDYNNDIAEVRGRQRYVCSPLD